MSLALKPLHAVFAAEASASTSRSRFHRQMPG